MPCFLHAHRNQVVDILINNSTFKQNFKKPKHASVEINK